jgi:transposase InsO family protein
MTWAHDDIMAGILEHRRHMAKSAPGSIGVIYTGILTDCAMKKSPRNRHKAPFLPIPVENAFNRHAVDCVGPFPLSNAGNRYVVVFTEYLTQWPEAFAVTDAPTIACLLVNHIITTHGAPRTLLSDQGTNFLSSLVRSVCDLLNTKKVNTTAYHLQTDGKCV